MDDISSIQQHPPPFSRDGKFHVKLIEGRFQNIRRLISWPLLAAFFILVWIQIDDQPLLLFSFELRRIILFGYAISWSDLPLLAGLLIAGAFLMFFMAVAIGRVWCGFACPQSIWTWLFLRIEDITEGPAKKRANNKLIPIRTNLLLRRTAKHIVWLILAAFTALTFTGYFIPVQEVLTDIMNWQLSIHSTGWLIAMTGLTYLNAGLMREKICLHACPYSRFQTVMFDQHTLTVSYDKQRGEPRINRRNADENSGDCVDCELCVQVCPTGIDIRDGLQAACIDCAACIDACDPVMEKLGRSKGLIRFASEAQLTDSESPSFRPQLIGYGLTLALTISAILYGFAHTNTLTVAVQRDRSALFTQLNEKTVCNDYQIKVEGFNDSSSLIHVSLAEKNEYQLFGPSQIDLRKNNASWLPYRVCTQRPHAQRASLTFNFKDLDSFASKTTTFLASSHKFR